MTGPVYVKGAEPGDLLDIEYLDIIPQPWGYTRFGPFGGFLSDLFQESFMVQWDIKDGWATSPKLPGVRIPDGCFLGVAGVAPSMELLREWTRRESDLVARGGRARLPDPDGAVPASVGKDGARTMPPRENCGNVDAKQLTRGSRLILPVHVPGALYSAGDAHFAQGDGEACITAIEMGATVAVRFKLHKGEAARHNIRWPRFAHAGYFNKPEWAAPRNFIATMGMPVREDGTQEDADLNLATRNALIQMIDLLQERGWTRQQAYIICSVAVDLRMSNIVDLPNVTVSAFLPEDIFTS
jgi:formamidase